MSLYVMSSTFYFYLFPWLFLLLPWLFYLIYFIILPDQQQVLLVKSGVLLFELFGAEHQVADVAAYEFLCFCYQLIQVIDIDVFAHDQQVELVAVDALRQFAHEVNFVGVSEVQYNTLDDIFDADVFTDDRLDIGEERVFGIGAEDLTRAFEL